MTCCAENVIAVFDIGKTNKKLLLFNQHLKLISCDETRFETIVDEDGVECDDIDKMEQWIKDSVAELVKSNEYNVKGVNFSTYGATLMYIDEKGARLTPAYNYLKEMPKGVVEPIYEKWGGVDEFSRQTASPALGMLNSGLQTLWLKNYRAEVFEKVSSIMHFPQYISYMLTNQVTSEFTSIGCHTAMWDFDNFKYHQWLSDEGIELPEPIANDTIFETSIEGQAVKVGVGIHDSSSSLAPYILGSENPFILISTGTWCINMNPYNDEPLTAEQLEADCLCFLSVSQKPVKSSRLFMGHIHEVNSKVLTEHFALPFDAFRDVKADAEMVREMLSQPMVFFKDGVPTDFVDISVEPKQFKDYKEAYHRLMIDLSLVLKHSIDLIVAKQDVTKSIYISGGFARNEIFVRLMAEFYPDKEVFTSEIDNSSALGAAFVIYKQLGFKEDVEMDLGLTKWNKF